MEQTIDTKIKDLLSKYLNEIQEVDVKLIFPNDWNPNEQPEIVYQSLKKSIQQYGWLQYPVLREYVANFQIIDGEHRVKAAKELGLEKVKCLVLGTLENPVSKEDAMILTQLLNTRGQDDVLKRAALWKELKTSGQQDLFSMLPLELKQVEEELKLLDFDFSQYEPIEVEEDDVKRLQDIIKATISLEKQLRRIYVKSKNIKLRAFIEAFFEWSKVLQGNVKLFD